MEEVYMPGLHEILEQAQTKGIAVGHFNIADFVMLKAVFASAQELKVPVIVGVSEGERKFLGVREIATLVRSLREEFDFPIFLNADHTLSRECYGGSQGWVRFHCLRPVGTAFEENIRQTKNAIAVLKDINPAILIEGEIGDIGTGSEIHDVAPDLTKGLTSPEEAKQYVDATGIDILAPAVGNMHGMLASMVVGTAKKHLDIARIAQIKDATGALITLHGASGTDDEDLRRAIAAGINVVHINTELRVAWRRGLEEGLVKLSNEVVPYKILPFALEAIKQTASSRLRLFNNMK
jgi:fructose-bisphosphate aldolase class II